MRRFGGVPIRLATGLAMGLWALAMAGCAGNSLAMKGQMGQLQEQQLAMTRQQQELQQRAAALDRDNQELGALLAQARQQSKLFEEQLVAVREQLRGTNDRLAEVQAEKESNEKRVQALTASMRRRQGVSITPNSSLLETLPTIQVTGVEVERDGDVIRVRLPGSDLFASGSGRLRPGAEELITRVAAELARTYPEQMIGVEGHTDTDPVVGGRWRNNHELSVARAMAVYDVLAGQTRLHAEQLFIAGHGDNHPLLSNATVEGKRRNRRVELVVYPEKRAGS
jgi:flagellar motor protein MotB